MVIGRRRFGKAFWEGSLSAMPPVAGLHISIGAHPFKFVPIVVESRCPIMESMAYLGFPSGLHMATTF